jgi:hypothetical protein
MAILSLPHDGENGLDDVYVGEEIDLKDLVDQADRATTLCQLFNSSNDGCVEKTPRVSEIMTRNLGWLPSLAAHKRTSIRPNASTASATAA